MSSYRQFTDLVCRYQHNLGRRKKAAEPGNLGQESKGADTAAGDCAEISDLEGDEVEFAGRVRDAGLAAGGLTNGPRSGGNDCRKNADFRAIDRCRICGGRHRDKVCPNTAAKGDTAFNRASAIKGGTKCNWTDRETGVTCKGRGHLSRHHAQVRAESSTTARAVTRPGAGKGVVNQAGDSPVAEPPGLNVAPVKLVTETSGAQAGGVNVGPGSNSGTGGSRADSDFCGSWRF